MSAFLHLPGRIVESHGLAEYKTHGKLPHVATKSAVLQRDGGSDESRRKVP